MQSTCAFPPRVGSWTCEISHACESDIVSLRIKWSQHLTNLKKKHVGRCQSKNNFFSCDPLWHIDRHVIWKLKHSFSYSAGIFASSTHTQLYSMICFSSAPSIPLSYWIYFSVLGQGIYFVAVRACRIGWPWSCWQGHCVNGSSGTKRSQRAHYSWQAHSSVHQVPSWMWGGDLCHREGLQ